MGHESLHEDGQFFKKNRVALPGKTVSFSSNDKLKPQPQLKNGELPQFSQEIILTGGDYRGRANIVAAKIFYNNSYWDGVVYPTARTDDDAIAPDKQPLSPCGTGSFVNVSNYNKGINGIIIDVDGLGVAPSASDFSFKIGNDNNPAAWATAPAPQSITVGRGKGVNETDRVYIIWADSSIVNTWLEVRVLESGIINVARDYVFYYGNLIGETDGDLLVTDSLGAGPPSDIDDIRDNQTGFTPATIDNIYDINKNSNVDVLDVIIARNNEGASINFIRPCMVVATHIFYNNSGWDSVSDNDAIATDKSALLVGGIGAFANITSYSKGINGIMIDIANVCATPAPSDFSFKIGNDNTPSGWADAPAPLSINTIPGGGVGGTCRTVIIWADDSIENTWLEVKVLASGSIGLVSDYVFYYGNLVGETGDDCFLEVTTTDRDDTVANTTITGVATITNKYDFNRDKTVDAFDIFFVVDNEGASLLRLQPGVTPTNETWNLPDTSPSSYYIMGYYLNTELDAEEFFANIKSDTNNRVRWIDPVTQVPKELYYNLAFSTWSNQIGNVKPGNGYRVDLTSPITIVQSGVPAAPVCHDLKVINQYLAYTGETPIDAEVAFADLITAGVLQYVRWVDPATLVEKDLYWNGSAWVNDIGNVIRGEGYTVRVTAPYDNFYF